MGRKPIVYGNKLSPPVRAVCLVAEAIGLDYEYKHLDFAKGDHMTEDYMKKNPQHTVPTLEDEGKFIWDSHAIITYLVDKYAKDDSLYPKDLYTRALVNQRLFFDVEVLYARLRSISMGIYFGKESTIPKEKINDVYLGYDFMEKFLENDKYLVGNSLTLADLCCIATISSTQGCAPVTADKYPKLWEWMKRMMEISYYERANGADAKIYVEFLKETLKKKAENANYKPF